MLSSAAECADRARIGPCLCQPCNLSDYLTLVVGGDEPEHVVVPEHDGLVDLALAEPRLFVARRKDLDGNVLTTPAAAPNLKKVVVKQWDDYL
jgi:hypothetical protein